MDSSENSDVQLRVDKIAQEYEQALSDGSAPSIEELIARHRDLEDQLRDRLQVIPLSTDDRTERWEDGDSSTNQSDAPTHVFVSGSGSSSDAASGPTSELSIGNRIGGYLLVKQLGQGGMGVVYEAEHTSSGRRVALKLLSPELPRTGETINRFLNEAALAAGLSHPRTTFIYEAGEAEGHFFIAMELMSGGTLRQEVEQRGPLPVNQAVDYILDVLDGLEAAHRAGVVHRDVKPSNCFLDHHGRIKVGDFGLSKSLVAESDLTRTGTFLGTPQFAAPEQFRRNVVDHRTDEFAVGATLYYLLSGSAPFTGDAAAVIAQIVADDPPPLQQANPDVPRSLSRIIERAMRKNPEERFRDANELRQALLPYSTHGTSIADVGRRVAALFIDSLILGLLAAVVSSVYAVIVVAMGGRNVAAFEVSMWAAITWIPYFAIGEGLFGCSVAKYWMGLRVVDAYGETPGIWRAGLRALILPGLTWMTIDVLQYRYNSEVFADADMFARLNVWNGVLVPQVFTLARAGLCLLVCSSMRAKNGFRGWHELLSGTRVVRLLNEGATSDHLQVASYSPVVSDEFPQTVGSFRVLGKLGKFRDATVLASMDRQLERPAWLYIADGKIAPSAERIKTARTTRQRWLQEGESDGMHWFAMEAVEGAPLTDIARHAPIPWSIGRSVLLQTVEETQASIAENTLPDPLEANQVWVNEGGRVKVLDAPLREPRDGDSPQVSRTLAASSPGENEVRIWRLLADVAEICSRDDETPGSALDLLDQLHHYPPVMTIGELHDQLQGFVRQPYRMRWDDRLGVLAISAGVETVIYGTVGFGIAMALASKTETAEMLCALIATGIGLILPALFGFATRGGLAFWLTKTEVRTLSRKLASRWRCAWRSALAWLPIVACQSGLGILIADMTTLIDENGQVIAGEDALMWSATGIVVGIFGIVQLAGAVFSVLQPRRGFQDLMAGTFLIRK